MRSCTEAEALGVAAEAVLAKKGPLTKREILRRLEPLPELPAVYNRPKEPCWVFRAPWNDTYDRGHDLILRPSRVIAVSRSSGKIVYDGSANDEG